MSGCTKVGPCTEDGPSGFAVGHRWFRSPDMNCSHSISGASVSHQEHKTVDLFFRNEERSALHGLATRLSQGQCYSH